ncbi:MAG TPA: flagellar basal body L-ring protein FlgH [Patescibacteria group bacterium]|nr:flagellar basal body L-ring protein FlgH [Patescibacteria group bacterium]
MKKETNTAKGLGRKTATAAAILAVMSLTACSGLKERMSRIGVEPPMSKIDNPVAKPGYQPVSLPMPPVEVANTAPNSLWQPARQTFFKDQRAHQVGDILTVMIDIDDEADMKNKTERSRTGGEKVGVPNLLGFESKLGKVLPDAVNPDALVGINTDSTSVGDGKIKREEEISLKLAAMVTQVLPNGNFVIQGRQEVRVNFELRELTLRGVVRPEDILNTNSISYDKIAEARISYGGKGTTSDVQQPRYGQQFVDAVFPF